MDKLWTILEPPQLTWLFDAASTRVRRDVKPAHAFESTSIRSSTSSVEL
jgi:hypothetical protein